MARAARKKSAKKTSAKPSFQPLRWARRWALRIVVGAALVMGFLIVLGSFLNPPTTYYMWSEGRVLGGVDHDWVAIEDVAPVMARAVVAAEDANFCLHWGLDLAAIQDAIAVGGARGGSTISQQVVKNVYLWHGRSYTRKLLEALITPALEAVWSKKRILEVYLNVAEFDEGVFGVEAASQHYFGIGADALSANEAARLAAILPAPKQRSAARPSEFVRKRAAAIEDGAATIKADGRAACFED